MKKIITLFLLCFIAVTISGCEAEVDRNAIYDNDTEIIKSADRHSANFSVYSLEDNELFMTARDFIGAKTIWHYTAKDGGDVTFSYSLSVSAGGKAKLVLITPDNEAVILSENTDNAETDEMLSQTFSLKKGNNRIKIVGYDDPSLNLILSVDAGELINE